jgi:hypothetical protein
MIPCLWVPLPMALHGQLSGVLLDDLDFVSVLNAFGFVPVDDLGLVPEGVLGDALCHDGNGCG